MGIGPQEKFMSNNTPWLQDKVLPLIWTALVTIFMVFPQALADRLKTGLNIADQRIVVYKEVAKSASTFNYGVDGIYQVYSEGLQQGCLNIGFARKIVTDYNTSITEVMTNEYIYKAEVKKLWRKSIIASYDSLYEAMKSMDTAIHAMNWMGIKLQPLSDTFNYSLTYFDIISLGQQVPKMYGKMNHLHELTKRMLDRLE